MSSETWRSSGVRALAGVLLGALALASCDAGPTAVIEEERVASRAERPARPGATHEQRFGTVPGPVRADPSATAGSTGGADGADGAPRAQAGSPEFVWATPEGWEELPASQFRTVNLRPAGHPDAECYVSFLPGAAGGLVANVNRWRRQMGQDELGPEAVAALPKDLMLGQPATVVDVEGAFTGMGDADVPDARLVGRILSDANGGLFVKMTGPKDVIAAELERFEAFVDSLAIEMPDPHAGLADPHAGLAPGAGTPPPAAADPVSSAQGFAWDAPESWVQEAPRTMRLVSFRMGPEQTTECYVAVLGGDGGGLVANINRWRGQVGLEPQSPEEIEALPTVEVLGREVPLVEGAGEFTGMDGESRESSGLLGVVCELGPRSVFVKMVGPRAVVQAERERFIAFVRSLREI